MLIGMGSLFREIIIEKFPNVENEMDIQIEDAFRTLNRQDQKMLSIENKDRI